MERKHLTRNLKCGVIACVALASLIFNGILGTASNAQRRRPARIAPDPFAPVLAALERSPEAAASAFARLSRRSTPLERDALAMTIVGRIAPLDPYGTRPTANAVAFASTLLAAGAPADPQSARRRSLLSAWTRALRGELRPAMEDVVNQALPFDHEAARTVFSIAALAAQSGDQALAAVGLEQAARLAPDRPDAARALGFLFLHQGDTERAAAAFQEAQRRAPNDHELARFQAVAWLEGGQLERALALLEDRAVRCELKASCILDIARAAFAGGELHRAREAITRAEAEQRTAESRYMSALVSMASHNAATAERALLEAVQLDPHHTGAAALLAEIRRATGPNADAGTSRQ